MEYVQLERSGGTAVVIMQWGKVNALNHALLKELDAAVAEAAADAAIQAVILTSDRPRFFSPGFDVAAASTITV